MVNVGESSQRPKTIIDKIKKTLTITKRGLDTESAEGSFMWLSRSLYLGLGQEM